MRRAVSTAYYGVFHFTCGVVADVVAGRRGNAEARAAAYRLLEHGAVDRAVGSELVRRSTGVLVFLNYMQSLRNRRVSADYMPDLTFGKLDVLLDIDQAEQALDVAENLSRDELRIMTVALLRKRRA